VASHNFFQLFRVFRRHAALLVIAMEELKSFFGLARRTLRTFDRAACRLKPINLTLAPCLTKSVGNIVQVNYATPH